MDAASFAYVGSAAVDQAFGFRAERVETPPASERRLTKASTSKLQAELVKLLPDLRLRALRLVSGDASRADDLVQDTFERALRFADQYQNGSNLRAWAGQVLFSVFVTRYRRLRRERNALRVLSEDPCAWTCPESRRPDQGVGLSTSTVAKLALLPAAFRDVVMLVDVGDHSYREAAEVLGVPVGTVMSRLHRGRKLLAAELAAA